MNWHSQEWQRTKRNKSMMINAAADDANFRQESCPGLTKPPPATYHLRRMSPCALCAGRKALPCFLSCWVSEVPCVWQPLLGNKNQADLNQFIINHNLLRTHERFISQLFWGLPCSILTSSYLIRTGYTLDPRWISVLAFQQPPTNGGFLDTPNFSEEDYALLSGREAPTYQALYLSVAWTAEKAREYGMENPPSKDIGCPRLRPASPPKL